MTSQVMTITCFLTISRVNVGDFFLIDQICHSWDRYTSLDSQHDKDLFVIVPCEFHKNVDSLTKRLKIQLFRAVKMWTHLL
jgi:hypothetical protein